MQDIAPKTLLEEIESRERDFAKVNEIVKKHRENGQCKTVWVARAGDLLGQDVEDARNLPGIKERLDAYDQNPGQNQNLSIQTLFSAVEGVGKAKTKAYFEKMEGVKGQLRELARKDEEQGTTTTVKCGGQQGLLIPGATLLESSAASAGGQNSEVAREGARQNAEGGGSDAAALAAEAVAQVTAAPPSGEAGAISPEEVEALRARIAAASLGSDASSLPAAMQPH